MRSPCHSDFPDKRKPAYLVMNVSFYLGVPRHEVVQIVDDMSMNCHQPDDSLPECLGCTNSLKDQYARASSL